MNIFISHHRAEDSFYYSLRDSLMKPGRGINPFRVDLHGRLGPKCVFDSDRLYEAIGFPDHAVAILSSDYLAEQWFYHELPALFALESRLKSNFIIPVLLGDVSDKQVPLFLGDRESFDCRGNLLEDGIERLAERLSEGERPDITQIFVTHGHDEAAKDAVARFIQQLGIEPVILHEQPNEGRTIIEKLERHLDVYFVLVLLTPDDVGASRDGVNNLQPRARQNVIFELGLFIGRLGRKHVCALHKGSVELPSNYQGVVYIPMDEGGGWKTKVVKELKQAGCAINMNTMSL